MMEKEKQVTVEIITPAGIFASVRCDSVQLSLSDDQKGRGKGCYGIRQGHAEAVLLLTEGLTTAYRSGEEILSVRTGEGFATVRDNVASIVVDTAELNDKEAKER